MVQSENTEKHKEAVDQLKTNFVFLPNKDQAWQDLHRLTQDDNSYVRMRAASALGSAFSSIPNASIDQAWEDLHRLTQDDDSYVRMSAASALGSVFGSIPDASIDQAWEDLLRLTQDDYSYVRMSAASALGSVFGSIPDASIDQAWQDLLRLTQDDDSYMRMSAVSALGSAFSSIPDASIDQVWQDLLRLTQDDDSYMRRGAASALGSAFSSIPDASIDQAWEDLHRLTQDDDSYMRMSAVSALGSVFGSIPDASIDQAWEDLLRLTQDDNSYVRRSAASALGSAFSSIPDASIDQACEDLHRLTQDDDSYMRMSAASALGSAFSSIPDASIDQSCEDLHRLTQDDDRQVRVSTNYSLGRVSILKATDAAKENEFKSELKNALEFFEKSNAEATFINPARFCHPFYKSIFSITFEERNAEAEVQEYIKEAKNAIEGSESKKTLLKAVENLENALREVHKSREKGLDAWKSDLKHYKRYCDRACNLLEITEKDAPGATIIIKRGLPIINQRIKEIIAEIHEKAETLCKQTRNTPLEDLGKEAYQIGKDLVQIDDSIGLEKGFDNLQDVLSDICKKFSGNERKEACRFLKKANNESCIEYRINLINVILSKISSQMSIQTYMETIEKKLDELKVSVKPGIRQEFVINSGIEIFGTGGKLITTIPLQEISYSDLEEDLKSIKGNTVSKLTSLPEKLADKIKEYLIRNKKDNLLKELE